MDLRRFVFSKLPHYYRAHDTYKDTNGEGILERLLYAMGVELQEETVDKLENFINELSPLTASPDFLSLLAQTVGNPIDIMGDEDTFKQQVSQAVNLYRYRGTVKGYKILFNILGYNVDEVEVIEPATFVYDDPGVLYDVEGNVHDMSRCDIHCLAYNIHYSSIPGLTDEPLTPGQLTNLRQTIINDIQPFNTDLLYIIYTT